MAQVIENPPLHEGIPEFKTKNRMSRTVYGDDRREGRSSEGSSQQLRDTYCERVGKDTSSGDSPDVSHSFEDLCETDWEGYLWKQGHVVRSWKYRYATLADCWFTYYTSKDAAIVDPDKYRGRVCIKGVRRERGKHPGFLIETTIQKNFHICTKSQLEAEVWVRMIEQALYNKERRSPSTSTLIGQKVRSSVDWKNRNYNTVQQYYNLWTAQLTQLDELKVPTAYNALGMFPLCSSDIIYTLEYPGKMFQTARFHGREGLIDVILCLSQILVYKEYVVTRIITTKKPNVIHIISSGVIYNKLNRKEYTFNGKDELQLTPGGRVLSVLMQIEVPYDAFAVQESEKKISKAMKNTFPSTSKRVLSLSIQHFKIVSVLGKGTFGTVVLAEKKSTKDVYAIKILEKNSMSNYDKMRTKVEMRILRDIHHPFIAPLR